MSGRIVKSPCAAGLVNEGNELNPDNGWYETFFRGYDPTLGRFLSIDPKADSYLRTSPYIYALDNPISLNDPLGADATQFIQDIWDAFGDKNYAHIQITDGQVTSWVALDADGSWSSSEGSGLVVWNQFWQENNDGNVTGAWMSLDTFEGLEFVKNQYHKGGRIEFKSPRLVINR